MLMLSWLPVVAVGIVRSVHPARPLKSHLVLGNGQNKILILIIRHV
jgi:hypothetical protein